MTFSPMFGKACQHVILSPLNGHVTEVASLMEGEWSHRGGQFNGEKKGHVTEVDSLIEGA